ncbi:hypothetical protein GOP47_0015148 [Adiantum capillus-veneris]|uniref:RBR-type E3 ubiquitin transferase n=1 Tax=Adiantum capillus-veneris TaxID=13818 RepID=A0A9D4UN15_ADICA|nr:hypothetical protein GOP47_0015148 [Adiantum capillus-veneris]
MDSDGDLQNSRSETSEKAFYCNDEDDCKVGSEAEDDDQHDVGDYDAFDEAEPISARKAQLPFTVLAEQDIKQRQEAAVESVMSVLLLSKTQAEILLRNFDWCANQVHEKWFANELSVRDRVGFLENPTIKPQVARLGEMECRICLEYHPIKMMQATACCDHLFCLSCWGGYAHTSISEGPGCLSLRCPIPGCNAAVGDNLILSVASQEDKKKYRRYILRSFVEANKMVKWCPAPRCENAIEFTSESGVHDVACACGHNFCWNCLEEVHRPVECTTVAKWLLKASAESENVNWILANSKPCPTCKRPIEKNSGCMHMTCTPPCKFEFCWLCLGPWSEHGGETGGYNTCNRYEAEKKDGKHREDEKRRRMAKKSLQRYTHYYERWASNEKSRTKALSDLKDLQALQLEKLIDIYSLPASQVEFIRDAWLQIIECRRVLKWTYAYGYYLPEEDDAKKKFFEYLQGQAEAELERLHDCAENGVEAYLGANAPTETAFNEFRLTLARLTAVTRTYFKNLVKALENGLTDVESSAPEASSKAKKRRKKGKSSRGDYSSRLMDEDGNWYCWHCTFANTGTSTTCSMCHHENS